MCFSDHDILCICGQPNLKEDMIGCDGQNCNFKWYHFSCPGITRETERARGRVAVWGMQQGLKVNVGWGII